MYSAKRLLLLLSLLTFIIFVLFSYLVSKETFSQFDFDMTVKIQDHISRKWDLPSSVLSLLGSAEIIGLIWFILAIFVLLKRYFLTFLALSLLPLGTLIEIFGKLFIYHPAPPYLFYRGVLDFSFPSHYVQTSYSYPSGHVYRITFLVTFCLLLLYFKVSFLKRVVLQLSLMAFLFLMIVSRIYLAEHWTSDVVGGALLGLSLGIIPVITIPLRKVTKEI